MLTSAWAAPTRDSGGQSETPAQCQQAALELPGSLEFVRAQIVGPSRNPSFAGSLVLSSGGRWCVRSDDDVEGVASVDVQARRPPPPPSEIVLRFSALGGGITSSLQLGRASPAHGTPLALQGHRGALKGVGKKDPGPLSRKAVEP